MSLAEDTEGYLPSRSPDIQLLQSSINTECVQLLRQFWNIHDEATEFLSHIRLILCRVRRIVRCGPPQNSSDDSSHGSLLHSTTQQLKALCDSITDAHRQFIALSQFQTHCKLITYSKVSPFEDTHLQSNFFRANYYSHLFFTSRFARPSK